MTKDFLNMISLYAGGVVGKEINITDDFDFEQVKNLAIEQSVWQTVFAGISEARSFGKTEIPDETFLDNKKQVLASVRSSMMKIEYTNGVLKSMLEKGYRFCVLKGQTVARYYRHPEMRVSSDIDILIDNDDATAWAEELSGLGYQVEKGSEHVHHFGAMHPVGGLLEVHTAMYYKTTKEIILRGLVEYNEPYEKFGELYCLGINDSAVYLMAHLLKHFVAGASGLRQISDILVYLNSNKDKMDYQGFLTLMEKLGFSGLMSALFGIGNKYFGFNFENADEEAGDMFLDDTELGGIFGKNQTFGDEFSYFFLQKRAKQSAKSFDKYYMKSAKFSLIERLFPTRNDMKNDYPVLEKYGILLPVLWVTRILGISKEVILKKRNLNHLPEEQSEGVKKKMELAKKLRMID